MNPQDIITYCRLHQIEANDRRALVRFWLPGQMTKSGRTRLLDRRGPSGEILEQRKRDSDPKEPEILVEFKADEVIREVQIRLQKSNRVGADWAAKAAREVRPGAEVIVDG